MPVMVKEKRRDYDSKSLVDLFQKAVPLTAPGELTRRVMGSLPLRMGWRGRLEYIFKKRTLIPVTSEGSSLLLPSSPAELGLLFVSSGVFFLCLSAVVMFRLDFPGPGMFPAAVAGMVLFLTGWRQMNYHREMLPCRLRLAATGTLFVLTMVSGRFMGTAPPLDLVAPWVGTSGLVITAGLAMLPRFLFTGHEVPHAKITCSI